MFKKSLLLFCLGIMLAASAEAIYIHFPAKSAVNPANSALYVADNNSSPAKIKVYKYFSQISTWEAAPKTELSLLNAEKCRGLAVSKAGDALVYSISAGKNSKIVRQPLGYQGMPAGAPASIAITGANEASSPANLAFSADETMLYCADGGNGKIYVFQKQADNSYQQNSAINSEPGIYDLAINQNFLYVSKKDAAGKIMVYDLAKNQKSWELVNLPTPTQIKIFNGKLYAAVHNDSANADIAEIDPAAKNISRFIKSGLTAVGDYKGFDISSSGWLIFKKASASGLSNIYQVNLTASGTLSASQIVAGAPSADSLAIAADSKAFALAFSKDGTITSIKNLSASNQPFFPTAGEIVSPSDINLDLTVLLEGYYNPATKKQNPAAVEVELCSGLTSAASQKKYSNVALDDGGHVLLPLDSITLGSYYIVVRHSIPGAPAGANHIPIITSKSLSFSAGNTTKLNLSAAASSDFVSAYKPSANDADPMAADGALKLLMGGDANGDGAINQADFGVWIKNNGSSSANRATWNPGADLNGDGAISQADFGVWMKNNGYGANYVP